MPATNFIPRPIRDFVVQPSEDTWIKWGINKLTEFGARDTVVSKVEECCDYIHMPFIKGLSGRCAGTLYDTACESAQNFGRRANLIQTAARTSLAVGVALTALAVGGSATAATLLLVPTAVASLPAAVMAGGFLLGWQGVALLVSTASAPVLAEVAAGAGLLAASYLLLEYHDLHSKIPVICWIPPGLLEAPLYPASLIGAAILQAPQVYNSLSTPPNVGKIAQKELNELLK